jgi:nitrite reductase/ring-hydroxylating ferredoxin subunit
VTTMRPSGEAPTGHLIAASEDIPEGGRLVVDVGGTTIGVFRFHNRLYAYENVCAHQGGPVCQGRLVHRVVEVLDAGKHSMGMEFDPNRLHLVCPWHGAEYDVVTGEHPTQQSFRLRRFPVAERNGGIHVQL